MFLEKLFKRTKKQKYMYSYKDIWNILDNTKRDFNKLTVLLNSEIFPQYPEQITNTTLGQLYNWDINARTIQYAIGIGIETLENILKERIPELEANKPEYLKEA